MRLTDRNSPAAVIATTLWGEARGEGLDGLMAVASVIWYESRRRKISPMAECLRPWRYSCWRKGVFQQKNPDIKSPIWKTCLEIANALMAGVFTPTLTASHYFNPKGVPGGWPKSWNRSKMTFVKKVKQHVFYLEHR